MALIVKNNIRKVVKELEAKNLKDFGSTKSENRQDFVGKENSISSVAEEVGPELEKKVEDILTNAIERAKANNRRTIQARDL